MKHSIPFVQYIKGGKKKVTHYETDCDKAAKNAAFLFKNNCVLDAEILSTGDCSFTVMKGEEMISCAVSNNGPDVVESVEGMIKRAVDELKGASDE